MSSGLSFTPSPCPPLDQVIPSPHLPSSGLHVSQPRPRSAPSRREGSSPSQKVFLGIGCSAVNLSVACIRSSESTVAYARGRILCCLSLWCGDGRGGAVQDAMRVRANWGVFVEEKRRIAEFGGLLLSRCSESSESLYLGVWMRGCCLSSSYGGAISGPPSLRGGMYDAEEQRS